MLMRETVLIPVAFTRQWGRRSELVRRQVEGVAGLVDYARRNVAHYRDDPAYDIGPIRSLENLRSLPIVDKHLLRRTPDSLVAAGVEPDACVRYFTSGSTGQRVRVLHDRSSHDYHSAALVRRFLATHRYLPTDRLAHIRPFTPPARAFERFGLFRRRVMLTDRPVRDIAEELIAYRPRVIIGYPVHLRALLHELAPAELDRLRRSVRVVMTESELLVPEHRAALATAFGARVFDEYSAFEVLNVAYDCVNGQAHLSEDRIVVEIVNEDGEAVPDGTEGRIVVTNFMERAMPLIRYDLGDMGRIVPGPCRCRRRFRRLELTRGRTNDSIRLPDGRVLYADTFLHIAATLPGIRECFVVQDEAGTVTVHVVPDGAKLATISDSIRSWLFDSARGPFEMRVVEADAAPLGPGGKGRFVTSSYEAG